MTAQRASLLVELTDRALAHEQRLDAHDQQLAKKPKAGKNGRGIDSCHINEDGDLIVRYSDGTKQNAGRARGKDGRVQIISRGSGGGGLSKAQVQALIQEAIVSSEGDYTEIEFRPDQIGNGTVKEFTFDEPVRMSVVTMVSKLSEATQYEQIDAQEGRATVNDQVPTADLGAVLVHEVPITLFGNIAKLNVLAPADTKIVVYGKR